MGFSLVCDICGNNPKTEINYECGSCGEESCDYCAPTKMKICLKCKRYFHINCAEKNDNDCEYCGLKLHDWSKNEN